MISVGQNDRFEHCLKCSVCNVYCPVMAVNGRFAGPKHAGVDQQRFRLKDPDFRDATLKLCMNCKRCEVACPSNVPIGDIIQLARLGQGGERGRLRGFVLSYSDLVGAVSTRISPVVNTLLGLKPVKYALDAVLKIDHRRSFPRYSSKTFETWFKTDCPSQKGFASRVAYFHGCYVNYNNPRLGQDMVAVLNALGVGVELLSKEKCCGIALISNGFEAQAKRQAEVNVASLRRAVIERGLQVLSTSSTCIFTLRDEYSHVLGIDNSDIRDSLDLATRYIYRLVTGRVGLDKLKFNGQRMRVAYHTPCHMERLGWSYYSIGLLRMIPSIDLTVLESQCCGIGGTYGFKSENYSYSQKIGRRLFDSIDEGGFDLVVTDCETCKWQIEMSTGVKCEHPISLFAQMIE